MISAPLLPDDALSIIFSFLPVQKIYSLRALNQHWNENILNNQSFINTVAKGRWHQKFYRMLKKTSVHLKSGRLIRLSKTLLLSELHADCSYSGLMEESKTAIPKPKKSSLSHLNSYLDIPKFQELTPVSEEPDESVVGSPSVACSPVTLSPFPLASINSKSSIQNSQIEESHQIAILREALECKIHELFYRLKDLRPNTPCDERSELSVEAAAILRRRCESIARTSPSDQYKDLIVGVLDLPDATNWIERVLFLMGQNFPLWNDMMLPLLICHSDETKLRDLIDRNWKLQKKWDWISTTYPDCVQYMIPFEAMIGYANKIHNGRLMTQHLFKQLASLKSNTTNRQSKGHLNAAYRIMEELFQLPDGCVELPVTFKELRSRTESSYIASSKANNRDTCSDNDHPVSQFQLWDIDEYEHRWKTEVLRKRRTRHCAEMYFPHWFLSSLQSIGRVSFIETSIFKDYEECSFYLLASEYKSYLVGVFWMKLHTDWDARYKYFHHLRR